MQVQRQFVDVKQRTMSIELPESFVNRRVEVIVLTMDNEPQAPARRRRPHPEIAGKGRTLGDLVGPLVDEEDWNRATGTRCA